MSNCMQCPNVFMNSLKPQSMEILFIKIFSKLKFNLNPFENAYIKIQRDNRKTRFQYEFKVISLRRIVFKILELKV